MLPLGAILLGSSLMVTVANDLARIDLEKTCHLAAGVQAIPTKDVIQFCINEEEGARDTLNKAWTSYPTEDKARCVRMATSGYLPSYIELLTCLEMSGYARSIAESDPPADRTLGRKR